MLFLRRTTQPLVEAYLASKRDAGRSAATLEAYRFILRRLAERYQHLPLDPAQLETFLRAHAGHSDETHAGQFRRTRTFYRWLVRRGHIRGPQDPFERMDAPRVKTKLPRVLSVPELRRVVEAARPGHERALILTLIDAGPRIGELSGCTKADLRGNVLGVSGKEGGRLLALTPPVAGYLRDLPTFNLFPQMGSFGDREVIDQPVHVQNLGRRVRRVMKRSGLTGPKLGPHTLRHSFATHFLRKSKDLYALARLLGHSSVRMSERYAHLDIDDMIDAHRAHSPMWAISGIKPWTPKRHLPTVDLSRHLAPLPHEIDGVPVGVMLVSDRRPGKTWYYLRARCGPRKWQIASLGSELPLELVDSLRSAVAAENIHRRSL